MPHALSYLAPDLIIVIIFGEEDKLLRFCLV
jgi:hypothetical protein